MHGIALQAYENKQMSEKLTHQPSPGVLAVMKQLRRTVQDFMTFLDASMPECREKSLAVTAFEESMMWAMKALSLNGPDSKIVGP